MRSFSITTPTPSIKLESSRQGSVAFAITNALDRKMRGRASVQPLGDTKAEWLALTGDTERDFAASETHQFSVKLALPPSAPAGQYPFQLVVVNVESPDEDYVIGPTVSFDAPAPPVPVKKKPFPWWIPAGAGALVLLLVLIGVAIHHHHEHAGTGGSGRPEAADTTTSVDFDGANSFVDLGTPGRLNFPDEVTVEAWVRPTATDGLRAIFQHGGANTTGLTLRINDGKYEAGSVDGGSHLVSFPVPSEDVGQWVHLAAVYSGNQWILYRNGKQVAVQADDTGALATPEPWAIGARGGSGGQYFKGRIRDVRLYRLPRTPQQVQADMKTPVNKDELGFVSAWMLGEGQGTLVRDAARNPSHGALRNATWATPNAPRGLEFNGTSTFVDLQSPDSLNFTGPITFEAWIRPRSPAGVQNVVAHGYGTNSEVFLRIVAGQYQVGSWVIWTSAVATAPIPPTDYGQWIHLAGVYDGAQWILYRNGEQVGVGPGPSGAQPVDKPWAIGARGGGGERFFNGSMRDVQLWRGARSAVQVQADMNGPLEGNEPGLVGYWLLNEGSGTTAHDKSPSKNNGTIQDPVW